MLEPRLPDDAAALFFDFDGTLTEIAPSPDAVRVSHELPPLLSRLNTALGGAVAIVSGRSIEDIDRWMGALRLPVAGVHGAERRGSDGQLRSMAVPDLVAAQALIAEFCAAHQGLRLERKPGAVALHYRQAAWLEAQCLALMREALRRTEGAALLCGKMVVELKPRHADKGRAIQAFLGEPSFRHRRPWFFGDDVTDEAAFEAVLAGGGVAVKIGAGDTLANCRLSDPASLLRWLGRACQRLEARSAPVRS